MLNHKGISILIPIYNVDVRNLVYNLDSQGHEAGIPYEIICFDDFSYPSFKVVNKEISSLPNIQYKELPSNIGRSKIRNELAKTAVHSHLLFLDCDSTIPSSSFLANYIQHLEKDLVIGGRVYHKEPPSQEFTLHWTVGIAREQRSASSRNEHPYQSFMSNNFLIEKKLFLEIQLDEKLKGYGHEDTKFGYELKKLKIPVFHIDNPVVHNELDENREFLTKSKEGVRNFYKITKEGYGRDTKLYKAYSILCKTKTKGIYKLFYSLLKNSIEKNLCSTTPSLLYFDLYKLYYFVQESNKKI